MKIMVLGIVTRRGRNCMKSVWNGLKLVNLYMPAKDVRNAGERRPCKHFVPLGSTPFDHNDIECQFPACSQVAGNEDGKIRNEGVSQVAQTTLR